MLYVNNFCLRCDMKDSRHINLRAKPQNSFDMPNNPRENVQRFFMKINVPIPACLATVSINIPNTTTPPIIVLEFYEKEDFRQKAQKKLRRLSKERITKTFQLNYNVCPSCKVFNKTRKNRQANARIVRKVLRIEENSLCISCKSKKLIGSQNVHDAVTL